MMYFSKTAAEFYVLFIYVNSWAPLDVKIHLAVPLTPLDDALRPCCRMMSVFGEI